MRDTIDDAGISILFTFNVFVSEFVGYSRMMKLLFIVECYEINCECIMLCRYRPNGQNDGPT